MKIIRLVLVLIALVVFGALIGYYISLYLALPNTIPNTLSLKDQQHEDNNYVFPVNAIESELIIHFSNLRDYTAYLKALTEVGLEPLGRIKELLVLRVSKTAGAILDLDQHSARVSFSYPVERPFPPAKIAPEAFAKLTAYGASARSVTGGAFAGNGEGVIVGILDSGTVSYTHLTLPTILRV